MTSSLSSPIFNSPHFSWEDPYLHIIKTDTDTIQQPPPNTENSFSLLEGDPTCNMKAVMWQKKLGELLVNDFLMVAPGKHCMLEPVMIPHMKF